MDAKNCLYKSICSASQKIFKIILLSNDVGVNCRMCHKTFAVLDTIVNVTTKTKYNFLQHGESVPHKMKKMQA